MSTPDVREERTGWRDEELSQRHRRWGFHCPALDVDLLFLEYDQGKATALVEYKHEHAGPVCSGHPTYLALVDLGNRAGIPVFCVRYADDFSWWKVCPLNAAARERLEKPNTMTEEEWVRFLYYLRGRAIPSDLFAPQQVL